MVALVVAGCSRGAVPVEQPTYSYTTPTAAAMDQSPAPSVFTHVYVMTTTWPDGNSAQETISLGDPVAPADAPAVSGGNLGSASSACLPLDDSHDLVVPFDIKLTNKNATLSLPAADGVSYYYSGSDDAVPGNEGVASVQFYTDGPQCESGYGSSQLGDLQLIALASADDLAPGASIESGGYILFSGVVQPIHPHGDPTLMNNSYLCYTPDTDNAATPKSVSGDWAGLCGSDLGVQIAAVSMAGNEGSGTINYGGSDIYAKPREDSKVLGLIPANTTITINCTATGGEIVSIQGQDVGTLWDHTTYNGIAGYVPDPSVDTGSDQPVANAC